MTSVSQKLRKLRGKSLAEVFDRTRQYTSGIAERTRLSSHGTLTDKEFFAKLKWRNSKTDNADLLTHFRGREEPRFYSSVSDRARTVTTMRRYFPSEVKSIIDCADSIVDGRFALLGYSDLYFQNRIPNWHYDPTSQTSWPRVHWSRIDGLSDERVSDKKVVWELNRHQYFTVLGRAYWLTDDEKYANAWATHVRDWISSNPPKVGVNWLSSLEISFRSISWIWAFYFFKDSPNLQPELLKDVLKCLYLNGRHVETYLSTYSSPNTHLTGEALGLYFIGTFLPELQDASRWKDLGYQILMDALDFQVRPDGSYCEQSSHYHRYTVDFYANLQILRQRTGEEIEHKHLQKLNQLFDYLLHITQPDGKIPLFGDDDGGRLSFFDHKEIDDVRGTLAVGAVLLDRPDLKFAARAPSPELLWLLGIGGMEGYERLVEERPRELSKAFMAGGAFALRESWSEQAVFLLVHCGEHGFLNGGHAHADALSFTMSMGPHPVFIDSGTYKYAPDPADRDFFRSTAAHNCLTVNGQSSSIPRGDWSWGLTADCTLLDWCERDSSVYFRGSHTGFHRFGVNYEREVTLGSDRTVQITDIINTGRRNNTGCLNTYEIHFVLSPHLSATIDGHNVSIVEKDGGKEVNLKITTKVNAEAHLNHVWSSTPSFVSLRYGRKIETTKLLLTVHANCSFVVCNTVSQEGVGD